MTATAFEAWREAFYCGPHRRAIRWVEDGTERGYCPDCLHEIERFAEAVVAVDREYHRQHDVLMRGCPFCYPGAKE